MPLKELFKNNRKWASRMERERPGFFRELAAGQRPEHLWIGCSDSRLPANDLIGLMPGELFVHRNIANIVNHSDRNCLAVIQFAVAELRVKHIIVVGHYGCGGVHAALNSDRSGLVAEWIEPICALKDHHRGLFDTCPGETARWDKLCELNVLQQAHSVSRTSIVRDAWESGQELTVHGWIFSVADGHLRDLGFEAANAAEADEMFQSAIGKIS